MRKREKEEREKKIGESDRRDWEKKKKEELTEKVDERER